MRNRFTIKAIAAAIMTLFAVSLLSPAAHADSQTNSAAAFKGTWTGPATGYVESKYTSGFEKIVISKVNGSSARGTWQYKTSAAAKWSSPKPANFSIFRDSDGDSIVNGTDSTGTYFGHLTPEGVWTLTYQSPELFMSLKFVLKKQ